MAISSAVTRWMRWMHPERLENGTDGRCSMKIYLEKKRKTN